MTSRALHRLVGYTLDMRLIAALAQPVLVQAIGVIQPVKRAMLVAAMSHTATKLTQAVILINIVDIVKLVIVPVSGQLTKTFPALNVQASLVAATLTIV